MKQKNASGCQKRKPKNPTTLCHWLRVNWLISAKPLISLWLRQFSWDRDHHEASAELPPFSFTSKSWIYEWLPSRSLCTPLGHPEHTLELLDWVIYAPHQQSSHWGPQDLGHNVKFRGYSCTNALHFSLGITGSRTLQYSDEGPAKGQTEIRLHIWANICEQFPPLFSKLYIWPASREERNVVLVKILLGTAVT